MILVYIVAQILQQKSTQYSYKELYYMGMHNSTRFFRMDEGIGKCISFFGIDLFLFRLFIAS